jgi:hypothetical protein
VRAENFNRMVVIEDDVDAAKVKWAMSTLVDLLAEEEAEGWHLDWAMVDVGIEAKFIEEPRLMHKSPFFHQYREVTMSVRGWKLDG